MGDDCRPHAPVGPTGWRPLAGSPTGGERAHVEALHRSPMAGPAGALWPLADRLRTFQPLAARRAIRPDLGSTAAQAEHGRAHRPRSVVHRQHLGPGQPGQRGRARGNVWPAPSASGLVAAGLAVCTNVSGLQAGCPGPRWRSARSGPHKGAGLEGHLRPSTTVAVACPSVVSGG